LIANSPNVTVSGVKIENSVGTPAGVRVDRSSNPSMIVNLNDLDINGGEIGVHVTGNGVTTNALTMTVNDLDIIGSRVAGMHFDDVDSGTVTVNGTTIDGNNATATAQGVLINDSDATFTFDTATAIREFTGTDFEVNNGAGTVTMNGDITNSDTAGHSIVVHNVTGGNVTFGTSSDVVDTNEGVLVDTNSGGSINLLGTYELNTSANDAVTITDNTGADISIGQLDITTAAGTGFLATGGGTLSVVGNDNTITSTGGTALQIEDMTIGSVAFESVAADGGTNGILLEDNLTGTITVGDTGNSVGDGGLIQNTDGAGVHVLNSNVTLNGVTVQEAGTAAGVNGVEMFHDDTNNRTANLNRLTVTNTTADRDGVVIDGTGNTGTFNANIQNLDVEVTGDGLVVDDDVTLTAGGTNEITSDTGVGLTLTDIAISGSGANFANVTVDNGASNGVVMQNLTGGQVAITGTGSTDDSGGMLNTADNAIVLTNVQNVDLNNVTVVDASNAGSVGVAIEQSNSATTAMDVTIDNLTVTDADAEGMTVTANDNSNFTLRLLNSDINSDVTMSATGSGALEMLVQDTTVDAKAASSDIAFSLALSGSLTSADVTLRNLDATANAASALSITSSGGTAKTFDLLIDQGSDFENDDNTASAAFIQSTGGTTINASIFDNSFTNNNAAGTAFEMVANGAGVRARLDLNGNTATDGTGNNFELNNVGAASSFEIFDLTNTFNNSRNTGTVVPLPNAAAFTNRVAPVPLPTIP
jgi:hypothetical protein